MTRPIQDVLDNADEIARRFEKFDPDEAIEIPVEEYLLQREVGADEKRSVERSDDAP
jgi:hypothetical protein